MNRLLSELVTSCEFTNARDGVIDFGWGREWTEAETNGSTLVERSQPAMSTRRTVQSSPCLYLKRLVEDRGRFVGCEPFDVERDHANMRRPWRSVPVNRDPRDRPKALDKPPCQFGFPISQPLDGLILKVSQCRFETRQTGSVVVPRLVSFREAERLLIVFTVCSCSSQTKRLQFVFEARAETNNSGSQRAEQSLVSGRDEYINRQLRQIDW